jgi:hypothetical protein
MDEKGSLKTENYHNINFIWMSQRVSQKAFSWIFDALQCNFLAYSMKNVVLSCRFVPLNRHKQLSVSFDVLTSVKVEIVVFYVVTRCRLVGGYRRFMVPRRWYIGFHLLLLFVVTLAENITDRTHAVLVRSPSYSDMFSCNIVDWTWIDGQGYGPFESLNLKWEHRRHAHYNTTRRHNPEDHNPHHYSHTDYLWL